LLADFEQALDSEDKVVAETPEAVLASS